MKEYVRPVYLESTAFAIQSQLSSKEFKNQLHRDPIGFTVLVDQNSFNVNFLLSTDPFEVETFVCSSFNF